MYQDPDDYFNPSFSNDCDNQDKNAGDKEDRGLNIITVRIHMANGRTRQKRVKVYTSGGVGSHIRDAETGEYYDKKVGSKDEDLFFKVTVATGECTSANGSTTLFYFSPRHYEAHLHSSLDPLLVEKWQNKRDARVRELKKKHTLDSLAA